MAKLNKYVKPFQMPTPEELASVKEWNPILECYQCKAESEMPLVALRPWERAMFTLANIIIRQCLNCGLEQNHVGHGETLTAQVANEQAPEY